MTIEEAKEELKQVRYTKELVKSSLKEIEEFRAVAYSPKAINYKSIGSGGHDNASPTENNAIHIVELEKALNDEIEKYSNATLIVLKKLTMLETRHKTILQLYYIDGFNLEQIGKKLHYGKSAIFEKLKESTKKYAEL